MFHVERWLPTLSPRGPPTLLRLAAFRRDPRGAEVRLSPPRQWCDRCMARLRASGGTWRRRGSRLVRAGLGCRAPRDVSWRSVRPRARGDSSCVSKLCRGSRTSSACWSTDLSAWLTRRGRVVSRYGRGRGNRGRGRGRPRWSGGRLASDRDPGGRLPFGRHHRRHQHGSTGVLLRSTRCGRVAS